MYVSIFTILNGFKQLINYIDTQQDINKIHKQSTNSLFQVFKFLCDKYSNLTVKEQQQLLKCLNIYAKKVYKIKNKQLSIQAIFFIIKFLLYQSSHPQYLISKQIFNYQQFNADIYQPHKDLLIAYISHQQYKNQLIKNMLSKIAINNPIWSSWWIFSLKNYNTIKKQSNKLQKQQTNSVFQHDSYHDSIIDELRQKIGNKIIEQLNIRSCNIDKQIAWIDWLYKVSINPQQLRSSLKLEHPPPRMISPFNQQMVLTSMIQINNINSGNSKPILIQMNSKNKNTNKQQKILFIRKQLAPRCYSVTGYHTESTIANFIKKSNLVDPSTTYSIIHLSKRTLLIQYIHHQYSLNQFIQKDIDNQQRKKIAEIYVNIGNRGVLGQLFDQQVSQIKYTLYNRFLNQGPTIIKSWWEKYNNFIKSYSQWNFICYIIELGDRHNSNILVKEDCKILHIDFQYAFGSSKKLPCPQWVPIRLTRGMISQLSLIQPYGLLYLEFIKAVQRYKKNRREIWQAQSHFSFVKKAKLDLQISKRATLQNPFLDTLNIFKTSTQKQLLRNMFAPWKSYA